MQIERFCAKCGTRFLVRPREIKHGFGKYCSQKCYHDAQIIQVEKACSFCGKTFKARAEQIRRGNGKFCSNKCKYESRLTLVERTCLHCGSKFMIQKSRIKWGYGKYCSKTCWSNASKGVPRTPEEREKLRIAITKYFDSPEARKKQSIAQKRRFADAWWYGSVNYHDTPKYCEKWTNELKERVRAFFNYHCVECGIPQNGERLHIHHVWYNKTACCDNTPRSLVALCRKCHVKTNYNRQYWSNHFQKIIDTQYNGKCWITKEEMKEITS